MVMMKLENDLGNGITWRTVMLSMITLLASYSLLKSYICTYQRKERINFDSD